MTEKKEICGVIVTYNPNDSCLYAIERNCKTLEKVIIYDNSTNAEYRLRLSQMIRNLNRKIENKNQKIMLIGNGQNVGLSKAYNISASMAEGLGFKFILLFDQDSFFENNGLELLIEDYDRISHHQRVGAIGPSFIHEGHRFYDFLFNGNFRWKGFYYSDCIIELHDLINSGMLIPLDVFNSVSGYDDRIFLDNADRNFTLRLRLNGYRLFQSKSSKFIHNYGEKSLSQSIVRILYRSPERDFYIRDLIWCLPIARRISFIDMSLVLILFFSKILSALFLKDRKKQRFYYIFHGIKSAILFDRFS